MIRVTPAVPTRYLTAEELERLGDDHLRSELWDGVLFVRDAATPYHGSVGARVVLALLRHVDPRRLGWVLDSSVGFLLARHPDRVLEPDGSFTSLARMPTLPERGFPFLAPDLVLEVRSPDSSWPELYAKGLVWIGHGVRVAWLVNPEKRVAIEMRPGAAPVVVAAGGALDASPVLDLRVPLDDVLVGVP